MLLPLGFAPWLRLIKRLTSGPVSLASIAHERDVICSGETEEMPPPIVLPGQIERVETRLPDPWVPNTTSEQELTEVFATRVTHPPTIAYHIRNAVLFDGSIYAGAYRYPLHPPGHGAAFSSPPRIRCDTERAALASTFLGTRYFGHWLADDCTAYLLAEEVGPPLCTDRLTFGHEKDYSSYFEQSWVPLGRAHVGELTVFQDHGQNSHKRGRYLTLRNRLKSRFHLDSRIEYVYLRRGSAGARRKVENEEEIVEALVARGFVVIDLDADRIEKILGILLVAKLVVSVEGSHLAHCIYTCPEGSALLVLQPSNRFTATHRSWSACLGIDFGFVVGRPVAKAVQNFSVKEVLLTIDLLLKRAALRKTV